MSKSKDIGTAAETAVTMYARGNGFPFAERRALHGTTDLGDVLMAPGFILEIKGGAVAEALREGDLAGWMDELAEEQANTAAVFGRPVAGMLVTKRRGYGPARAGYWFAHFSASEWLEIPAAHDFRVTTPLAAALDIARWHGYGDPPNLPAEALAVAS